jgi:predicted  nucleic acid-binding Zn-ribbon protein
MSAPIDPLALAGAKSKGRRPWFLDREVEKLTNITLALAQELAVTRERLDTLERLIEKSGVLTRQEIETFSPTKAEADQRGAWMQEYLARVFRILQQENEALALGDEPSSEEVAETLARR